MRISEQYDTTAWILRIFFGGVLNIIFSKALSTFVAGHVIYVPDGPNGSYYLHDLFTPSVLPQFAIYVIMVLLSPFLISLILTKRSPNLKIVPPVYVAIIGWAYLLVFQTFPLEPNRDFLVVMFGLIMVAMGAIEDKFVTSILGVATERENIYFEHMTVFAEIDDVKARICVPEIRDALDLSHRIEGDADRGYTFRTNRGHTFIKTIQLTKNKEYPDEETDFKVVYYEKARYNLRVSPAFLEYSRMTSAILKDILFKRAPSLGFAMIMDLKNDVRDPLVNSVVDEMYGYYVKSKRLSFADQAKIAAVVGVFVMSIALFVFEQPLYGGVAAVLDALIALSELPDIVRKQT